MVPVTVDFTLETPRAFTEAELRLWWGSTSTKGTAYQLKSVEVLAGNDLNSLKRLALLDTSKDQHPDFGKTVVYRIPDEALKEGDNVLSFLGKDNRLLWCEVDFEELK